MQTHSGNGKIDLLCGVSAQLSLGLKNQPRPVLMLLRLLPKYKKPRHKYPYFRFVKRLEDMNLNFVHNGEAI